MARPKKDNAEYFSHDRDMRNDNKVKAVRRKFKNEGYAIWNMLLEHLTDCDFFEYEYNDLNVELLSGDFDIEPNLLKQMIDYFIRLKLLEFNGNYIYCPKLTERFETLLKKRNRERKPPKRELSPTITPTNEKIAVENPQSKVKESKGDYSKGEEEEKEKEISNFNNKLIDIEKLPFDYLKNTRVVNAVIDNRKNKFKNLNHLEKRLFEFCRIQTEQGVLNKTMADFSSHFRFWHLKQNEKGDEVQKTTNTIPIG